MENSLCRSPSPVSPIPHTRGNKMINTTDKNTEIRNVLHLDQKFNYIFQKEASCFNRTRSFSHPKIPPLNPHITLSDIRPAKANVKSLDMVPIEQAQSLSKLHDHDTINDNIIEHNINLL